MSREPRRVLSLGAGVQSSTLYLMAVRGEFGAARPEVAIFADTQWEPVGVYEWLAELEQIGSATIPIHRVTIGNIREKALSGKRFASMPLYTIGRRGAVLDEGMLRRQCTREFKVAPVTQEIRRSVLGLKPRQRVAKGAAVELWMGISTDEASRMKPNREPWITNRWPLIERDFSRRSCWNWLRVHGFPEPPKSACIGCPYTDDHRWREMQRERPTEFADAVDFDAAIRTGVRKVTQEAFLHRSLKPLSEVDFSSAEDRGQVNFFENECEGMCGV